MRTGFSAATVQGHNANAAAAAADGATGICTSGEETGRVIDIDSRDQVCAHSIHTSSISL